MVSLFRATPPSYSQGYAQPKGGSLVGAWVPGLGVSYQIVRDVSRFGNHGTLTNMDPSTDWVAGGNSRMPGGYAIKFTPPSETIVLDSRFILDTSRSWTLTWTIRLDAYTDSFPGIFKLKTDQLQPFSVFYNTDSASYRPVTFGAQSAFVTVKVDTDWSADILGEWETHSLVFDGIDRTAESSYTFYREGVLFSTSTSGTIVTTANSSILGLATTAATEWDGRFSMLLVENRALVPQEIAQRARIPLVLFERDRRIIRKAPAVGGLTLGQGVIAGAATVVGQTLSTAFGQGTVTGTATVAGQGLASALTQGQVVGISTVLGEGVALSLTTGAVVALGAVAGQGLASALTQGEITGTAEVLGFSDAVTVIFGQGIIDAGTLGPLQRGEILGVASVLGIGVSLSGGLGAIAGEATLEGLIRLKVPGQGIMDGIAAVAGQGFASARAQGAVAGIATVDGRGVARVLATGGI